MKKKENGKDDIRGLTVEELTSAFVEMGEREFRARQVQEWLWVKSCTSFEEMSKNNF